MPSINDTATLAQATVIELQSRLYTTDNRQKQERLGNLRAKSRPSRHELTEIDTIQEEMKSKLTKTIEEALLFAFKKAGSFVTKQKLHKKLSIMLHSDRAQAGPLDIKLLAAFLKDFGANEAIQTALNKLKEQDFKNTAFVQTRTGSTTTTSHTIYEELPFSFQEIISSYLDIMTSFETLSYIHLYFNQYKAETSRYIHPLDVGAEIILDVCYTFLVNPVVAFELSSLILFTIADGLQAILVDIATQDKFNELIEQYAKDPEVLAQADKDYLRKIRNSFIRKGVDQDKLGSKELVFELLTARKTQEFSLNRKPLNPVIIAIEVGNDWEKGRSAYLLEHINGLTRLNLVARAFYQAISTPLPNDVVGILTSLITKLLQITAALVLLPTAAALELARFTRALLYVGLLISITALGVALNSLVNLPLLAYDALASLYNTLADTISACLNGFASAASCGDDATKTSSDKPHKKSSRFGFFSSTFCCGDEDLPNEQAAHNSPGAAATH